MTVRDLYWFEHSNKVGNVSSARVHKLFDVENGDVHFDSETMEAYKQKGLSLEVVEGF